MTPRIYIAVLSVATALLVHAEETNAVVTAATNVVANAVTNVANAGFTNAVTNAVEHAVASTTNDSDAAISFNDFKIITQRNIFDPNRRTPGSRPTNPTTQPKPTRIDYLNLVGAMSYEKGRFAFFDGSSSDYRKSVKPGDSIAGYKVADVTTSKVTLESGDQKLDLPVGGQMKRVDEGEWKLNSNPESFASSGGSSSSSTSSSTGSSTTGNKSGGSSDEPSDALKRLLERRKNEK